MIYYLTKKEQLRLWHKLNTNQQHFVAKVLSFYEVMGRVFLSYGGADVEYKKKRI